MPAQLTLGTGALSGRTAPSTARRVIDAAIDAGIRCVDTARAYGDGETERVVGAALRSRSDVSVITKVGLGPLDRQVVPALRWRASAPLLGLLPSRGGARSAAGDEEVDAPQPVRFDEASVRSSIDVSRRALRRDRLDMVLLHELDAAAGNDRLVDLMDALVVDGVIGAWGVGTRRPALRRLVAAGVRLGGLVQTTGGPLLPVPPASSGAPLSVHSVLGPGGGLLSAFLTWLASSEHRGLWERSVGPIDAPRTAGEAIIRTAVADERNAAVLLSSRDPMSIARTINSVRAGETAERTAALAPVFGAFRAREA